MDRKYVAFLNSTSHSQIVYFWLSTGNSIQKKIHSYKATGRPNKKLGIQWSA